MSTLATKFKPKFLYKDGDFIRQNIKFNEEKLTYLNNCLVEVEKLFDKELTIKEKTEILQFGWKKIVEMFRSNSQYPNAKIKALLELNGKNGDEAEKVLKEHSSKFRDDIFIVKNTGVEISEKYLTEIEKRGNYYTTSQAQNEKLEIITKIANNLNEAIDVKILHKWQIQDIIKNTNSLLNYGVTKHDNEGFRPNYERIRKL